MWALSSLLIAGLALVSAQGPPPDQDDPYVLHLPSSLTNDTIREKILKPCNDPLIKTIDNDVRDVWDGLGCYYLHGLLDYDWYINQTRTEYSYVEYISNKMHGPENWRCHLIDNDACNVPTVQCHETAFACGYLIMNSFGNIHKMLHRGYETVKSAHDRIQDDIPTFTEIFAPEVEVFDALGDVLIPIITLGFFGASAFMTHVNKVVMNTIKNNAKKKKWEDRYPLVKDGVTQAVGMAMPYGLIHLPEKASGDTTRALVFNLLGSVYDHFLDMQLNHTNALFSGNSESLQALYKMIDGGAFVRFEGADDVGKYHVELRKMFIAALLPGVWRIAPEFAGGDKDKFSAPFFGKTHQKCGESVNKDSSWVTRGETFHTICRDDEEWVIAVAHMKYGIKPGASRNNPSSYKDTWYFEKLKPVPGTEKLVSEDGYLGVRAVDMLESSLNAIKEGGQLWQPDKDTPYIKKDGSGLALAYSGGVSSPGLVQMPACDLSTAFINIQKACDDGDTERMTSKAFPCDS